MNTLCVPVSADLVGQIILRSEGRHDVAALVNSVLQDFLDRTYGDADVWSERHAKEAGDLSLNDRRLEYGEPTKGYRWKSLFLPNGSQLRAMPRGIPLIAEVKRERLVYQGQDISPSQFASMVRNNTSRSAPRDLYVKRPGDTDWIWAWELFNQTAKMAYIPEVTEFHYLNGALVWMVQNLFSAIADGYLESTRTKLHDTLELYDCDEAEREIIEGILTRHGLIVFDGDDLRLTDKGRRYAENESRRLIELQLHNSPAIKDHQKPLVGITPQANRH